MLSPVLVCLYLCQQGRAVAGRQEGARLSQEGAENCQPMYGPCGSGRQTILLQRRHLEAQKGTLKLVYVIGLCDLIL